MKLNIYCFANVFSAKAFCLYIICFIVFFASCSVNNDGIETIQIDIKGEDTVTPETKIESLIRLETTDSTLIGEITRIQYYLGYYYIFDRFHSKAIFKFDAEGKFIKKTRLGKGPGEILEPWDFYIDKQQGHVIIFDQATYRMMKFDLNLNYISHISNNELAIRNFVKLGPDTTFVFAQSRDPFDENADVNKSDYYNYLVFTDNCTKVIQKLIPTPHSLISLTLESPIFQDEDGIIFAVPMLPFIYSYNENEANPCYFLDYGNYAIKESDLEKGLDHIFELVNKGNRVLGLDHLYKSPHYIAFSYFFKRKANFIIHSKHTKSNYYSKDLINKNIIPECKLKGMIDDAFIGIISPSDYINFCSKNTWKKSFISNPNSLDNPYIMVFKLKGENNIE